jgi:hypothetical protein
MNEDQPVAVAPVDQLRFRAVLLDDEPASPRIITDEGAAGISHGSDGNTWRISSHESRAATTTASLGPPATRMVENDVREG